MTKTYVVPILTMDIQVVHGDLLKQKVEVIVNPWNRNVIPWWLLLPQGVSGAIKQYGGARWHNRIPYNTQPFKELAKTGVMSLGSARLTSAGRLPFKAIIHVAGINLLWFATRYSVQTSVLNAMALVEKYNYQSVAFPVIGSGSGNRGVKWSLNIMQETFQTIESTASVTVVVYSP